MFTAFWYDLRYAVRVLRRQPAPAAVAIVTIALGIAATTVLFSVTWNVLIKPLPWPDAGRLIRVSETRQGSTRRLPAILTNGTYLAWRHDPATIEEIAGWTPRTVTVAAGGEPQRLQIAAMTASAFRLLQARPVLGAPFSEADELAGGVVAISRALWRQRFGGAADAIGRVVEIDGERHRIVAVMPGDFAFPDRTTQAWVPFRVRPVVGDDGRSRSISLFSAVARLRPGITPAQAAQEGTARARSAPDPGLTAIAVFGSRGAVDVAARPVVEAMTADVKPALLILLAAVGLLLAAATGNVAGVQLARVAVRRKEMAVRGALGAGGARLARQLLIENTVLGVAGGAAGLAVAALLHRSLPRLLPPDFPRVDDLALDVRVLTASLLVSVIVSVLFGSLPALHARRIDLVSGLREDSGAAGHVRTSLARNSLIAVQVAIACVLLTGAALLSRSFVALMRADRGYETADLLTARLPMPDAVFSPQRRAQVTDAVLARLTGRRDLVSAAASSVLPLGTMDALLGFTMAPGGTATGEPMQVQTALRLISPGYFTTVGMPLVEGRGLTDADTVSSPGVVIVNQAFARRYLNGQAVGRRITPRLDEARPDWEIVGVVADAHMRMVQDPPQPELFVSYRQIARGLNSDPLIVLRTVRDPAAFAPSLRQALREVEPSIALDSVMTMEQRLTGTLARPRLYAIVLAATALFAVVIAAVGLFGSLSYSVAQRAKEIGVRTALGARPLDIITLIVGQTMRVTALGLALGIAAALVASRALTTFLYGVAPHDPATFIIVAVAIVLVAALACVVPARRAAKLDPLPLVKSSG